MGIPCQELNMSAFRELVPLAVLTVWVWFFGTGVGRAVQPATAATGVVAQLKAIRAVLEHADHDYKGHRAKAVQEITKAIHAIEGVGARRAALTPQQKAALQAARQAKIATKQGASKPEGEPQALSDQQLKSMVTQLTQVSAQIGTAKPVAQQHVQNAIVELQAALAIK
jgi:hypothetical protein